MKIYDSPQIRKQSLQIILQLYNYPSYNTATIWNNSTQGYWLRIKYLFCSLIRALLQCESETVLMSAEKACSCFCNKLIGIILLIK